MGHKGTWSIEWLLEGLGKSQVPLEQAWEVRGALKGVLAGLGEITWSWRELVCWRVR